MAGLRLCRWEPTDKQMLMEFTRAGEKLVCTDICSCRFVKLIGEEGWTEQRNGLTMF